MLARRILTRVAVLLALLGGAAHVAVGETLVLVSPPTELDAAVRSSLAPWRVKIIVVALASGTPAELALTQGAGFVVWRDDDELVLWNATAGTGERRDIPADLDDAGAAALALSIKTWMNLGAPPPPLDEPPVDDGPPADPPGGRHPAIAVRIPRPPPPPPPRLRVDLGSGVRSNAGDHGRTELRGGLAVSARLGPVEAGVAFELGAAHPATATGGTGDFSTLVVGVRARWPVELSRAVRLSPGLGLDLVRTGFSGTDTMDRAVSASASSPGIDASTVLEWRSRQLLIGVDLGVTALPKSAHLQDRNVRLDTPAHIEPRAIVRFGVILR